jgi:hypothetical protein
MKNPAINGISQYQESQEITAGMTMSQHRFWSDDPLAKHRCFAVFFDEQIHIFG